MEEEQSIRVENVFLHDGEVNCLAFNSNGLILAYGGGSEHLGLWDVLTENCIFETFKGSPHSIHALCFSSDSSRLACGLDYGLVKVYSALTGEVDLTLQGHTGSLRCMVFSKDSRYLYTGSDDCTVHVWNVADKGKLSGVLNHFDSVQGLTMCGDMLISASYDQTVKVWNMKNKNLCVRVITGFDYGVTALASSPDETLFAAGSFDAIKIFEANELFTCVSLFDGNPDGISALSFSTDGTVLAFGSDKKMKVSDVGIKRTVKRQRAIHNHADTVTAVVFSPDGSRVVSTSKDGAIASYRLHTNAVADF